MRSSPRRRARFSGREEKGKRYQSGSCPIVFFEERKRPCRPPQSVRLMPKDHNVTLSWGGEAFIRISVFKKSNHTCIRTHASAPYGKRMMFQCFRSVFQSFCSRASE